MDQTIKKLLDNITYQQALQESVQEMGFRKPTAFEKDLFEAMLRKEGQGAKLSGQVYDARIKGTDGLFHKQVTASPVGGKYVNSVSVSDDPMLLNAMMFSKEPLGSFSAQKYLDGMVMDKTIPECKTRENFKRDISFLEHSLCISNIIRSGHQIYNPSAGTLTRMVRHGLKVTYHCDLKYMETDYFKEKVAPRAKELRQHMMGVHQIDESRPVYYGFSGHSIKRDGFPLSYGFEFNPYSEINRDSADILNMTRPDGVGFMLEYLRGDFPDVMKYLHNPPYYRYSSQAMINLFDKCNSKFAKHNTDRYLFVSTKYDHPLDHVFFEAPASIPHFMDMYFVTESKKIVMNESEKLKEVDCDVVDDPVPELEQVEDDDDDEDLKKIECEDIDETNEEMECEKFVTRDIDLDDSWKYVVIDQNTVEVIRDKRSGKIVDLVLPLVKQSRLALMMLKFKPEEYDLRSLSPVIGYEEHNSGRRFIIDERNCFYAHMREVLTDKRVFEFFRGKIKYYVTDYPDVTQISFRVHIKRGYIVNAPSCVRDGVVRSLVFKCGDLQLPAFVRFTLYKNYQLKESSGMYKFNPYTHLNYFDRGSSLINGVEVEDMFYSFDYFTDDRNSQRNVNEQFDEFGGGREIDIEKAGDLPF
jgi:hypothetical protein